MTEQADAGDVLKQRAVTVDANETTHTLDLKCYEAGVESFAELVDELAADRHRPMVQDLDRRTYHGKFERLPRGGIVSWRQSAEELDAAVRACDFGSHLNEFGTVKLSMGRDLVVVKEAKLCQPPPGGPMTSQAPAGTIVEVSAHGVSVATTSRDLCLTRFATLSGAPLTPVDLVARWGVEHGDRFEEPDAAWAEGVTAACEATCRHEAFWVRRLTRVVALDVGSPISPQGAEREPARHFEIPIPGEVRTALAGDAAPDRPSAGLLTAFLVFLTRLTGEEGFDVDLRWREQPGSLDGLDELFAARVPFRAPELGGAESDTGRGFGELREEVVRRLEVVERRKTYLRDVGARYPQLERFADTSMPVAVELVEDLGATRTSRAALLVEIPRHGNSCRWSVAQNVLEPDAEALQARFAAFLQAVTESVEHDVTRIPLLSDAKEQRLLAEWNDTATDYPRDRCFHQLFLEQARRRPDAPAVDFEDHTLTYGELERRSTRLAVFLGRRGIGPGDLVGLYMKRSAELVVSLLAVLKSGAAYVPLDSIYPPARIADMLEDTDLPLLLTESSLERDVEGCKATVVSLDRSRAAIAAMPDDKPYDRATPDGLAYVIYTSGSTGRPKGAKIVHRGLTNVLCSMARTPGFSERDKMLAVSTICFDMAVVDLFLPLVTGGRVEVAASHLASDGFALGQRIEQSRATVMQGTPATWRMLIAAGWAGAPGLKVVSGGEPMTPELADGLLARAREVWNGYGLTEATIYSSFSAVEPDQRITVGRPIANTRFYVLDPWLQPVPPGMPGELWIAGDGVAQGYLERPELTAQRFVKSPFGEQDGVLYRSGDLVRYLDDGEILYLNRCDNQVKLRGFRIELGEIEHALSKHPAVREAVVLCCEAAGNRQLVAYLVPASPGGALPLAELRSHLEAGLPDYMVPSAFMVVERIPLSPNGKVDRKALPSPQAVAEAEYAEPATEVEQQVAEIWQRVLRLDRVGVDDNFREVGGNSLLLTEVVKQLREERWESLTIVDMFKYPTIRMMAQHLSGPPPVESAAAGPPPPYVSAFGGTSRRDRAAVDELRQRRRNLKRSGRDAGT